MGSDIFQVQSKLLGYEPGNPGLRITPLMLVSVPPQVAVKQKITAFCVQQGYPNLTQLIGLHRERESPQGAV